MSSTAMEIEVKEDTNMGTTQESKLEQKRKPTLGLDEEEDEEEEDLITLVPSNATSDEKRIKIPRSYASMSSLIATALEDDPNCEEVPILSVETEALEKVVEYLKIHRGVVPEIVPQPVKFNNIRECISNNNGNPKDADFVESLKNDKKLLYDVTIAANYMDIKSLLYLLCAELATRIKGQPLEKIKHILDPEYEDQESDEEKKEI